MPTVTNSDWNIQIYPKRNRIYKGKMKTDIYKWKNYLQIKLKWIYTYRNENKCIQKGIKIYIYIKEWKWMYTKNNKNKCIQ